MEQKNSRTNGNKKKQAVRSNVNQTKTNKKNPYLYVAFGLSFLLIIVLSAGIYFIYQHATNSVDHLKNEVVDLRSAMNTDSVRQFKLQKILRIIKEHNPSLSSEEAYDIANAIHEMSIKYTNLDEDLLCAVITHESANSWNPRVLSPAGAMGLMQIMPVTGMFLAEYDGITWNGPEEVLFNPVYNIRMGSRFLSSLINEYKLEGALAAYNGGERMASKWLASGQDDQFLYKETRNYIPAIISLYGQYSSESL